MRAASAGRSPVLAALLALALALAPGRAAAQNPVAAQCDPDTVLGGSPGAAGAAWSAHHPRALLDALAAEMAHDDWVAVVDAIAASFRGAPAEGRLPAEVEARFGRRLDSLRTTLARVGAEAGGFARDRATVRRVSPSEFRPVRLLPMEGIGYRLFEETPEEIVVDTALSAPAQRRVCWAALAVLGAMQTYSSPAYERAVGRLAELDRMWENYAVRGYSQLPWEVALNDLLFVRPRESLEPPRNQLILLHPSVALEVEGGSWDEMRRRDAAMLEPIGYLRYNADRSSYLGLALLLSFPDDATPGLGAALHLGRQATLGYVHRDAEPGGPRSGVILSLDLYRLVAGVPARLREAWEALPGSAMRGVLAEVLRPEGS